MRPPSLGNVLIMVLLAFALLSLWAKVGSAQTAFDPATFYSDCWENCFSSANAVVGGAGSGAAGTGTNGLPAGTSLQNEYDQLYKLVEAMRTTRLTSGSNATLFVIDTSLTDPTSQAIQKLLLQLAALTTPVTSTYNPAYFVEFDGTGAWYKQSWEGLGRCDALKLLNTLSSANYTSSNGGNVGVSTTATPGGPPGGSGDSGKIENACLVGAHALNLLQTSGLPNRVYDTSYVSNPNLMAFVNNKFETFDSACGADEFFGSTGDSFLDGIIKDYNKASNMPELLNPSDNFNPYCARFFDDRFIVGSGNADPSDMASWSSTSADIVPSSSFVPNTPKALTALQQLESCMASACCPPPGAGRSLDFDDGLCITADLEENFKVCDLHQMRKYIVRY